MRNRHLPYPDRLPRPTPDASPRASNAGTRTLLSGLLVLATAGLAWACEAPETEPSPETESQMMEETTPPETAPETAEQTIPLSEVNGSSVSGEAVALHSEESVTVVIELEGLPEAGEYAAHVHSGTCETGGGVAVPLDPVLGLADGTGSSTTILEPDDVPGDEPLFIQVHGEGGAPIACGNVEGHGADAG